MPRYFIFMLGLIGYIKIFECYNPTERKNSVVSYFLHSKSIRIINGVVADMRDFPYMVSLQFNGTFFGHDYDHFCCGSIINKKWIITSAQCALAREIDDFHVRLGSSKYYENGTVYKVKSVEIHPNYNEILYDYDVALLELSEEIIFTANIKPISIQKENEVINDSANLSIAGWGAIQFLGKISDDLHESHVQKLSDETCRLVYGNDSVTDRMFCVYTEGFGPCVGDSGSPAILNNKLIGLASWSHNCAYGFPSVYAKVSSVLDWIKYISKGIKI